MSENSTLESKKSRTIEDRIDILQKRNLLIDDYQLLYKYIKNINTYYHITGYRFLLDNYNAEEDDYHNHNCTELIALCELDKKISILLFQETRKIEESLRTKLANLCGQDDMVTFKLDDINEISLLKDNYCFVNNSRENLLLKIHIIVFWVELFIVTLVKQGKNRQSNIISMHTMVLFLFG